MAVTPADLYSLALERHRQPWNWSLQFAALWLSGLTLLFHSYLLLATALIFSGTGFFRLSLPDPPENRWFAYVDRCVEWEKNWLAAPWNFYKWGRFLFVLALGSALIWSLWTRELAALGLVMGFVCLMRVRGANRTDGIDP